MTVEQQRDMWIDTARTYAQNADYWRERVLATDPKPEPVPEAPEDEVEEPANDPVEETEDDTTTEGDNEMILGRPVNLVLGAITAVFNVVVLVANSQGSTFFTPEIVAGINIALAAVIGLIASQPPTVNSGDKVNVTTPSGQPNASATVGVTNAGEVTVSQ